MTGCEQNYLDRGWTVDGKPEPAEFSLLRHDVRAPECGLCQGMPWFLIGCQNPGDLLLRFEVSDHQQARFKLV